MTKAVILVVLLLGLWGCASTPAKPVIVDCEDVQHYVCTNLPKVDIPVPLPESPLPLPEEGPPSFDCLNSCTGWMECLDAAIEALGLSEQYRLELTRVILVHNKLHAGVTPF